MKLPQDNLNYPVKILIGAQAGSGFLVAESGFVYLVTAKHVLYRFDSATKNYLPWNNIFTIRCQMFNGTGTSPQPSIFQIDLQAISPTHIKQHTSADMVLIKVASRNDLTGQCVWFGGTTVIQGSVGQIVIYPLSGARKFADVEVTNEVFTLGYPVAISTRDMNQIDYDRPLARKGIIAGKNELNRTIILDCPVYGGNSGGLVLEMNAQAFGIFNIHLIGIVIQYVPFIDQWQNVRLPELVNTHMYNSGYSVVAPVDYIHELINQMSS